MLYHFTSPNALRAIHRHGLTIGDVPISLSRDSHGLIGVWLTTSATPGGHGLGGRFDKRRCRLEVTVDAADPKLKRWADWAPERVSPDTMHTLIDTDGHAWRSWFVYFGWISPDHIESVTDLDTGDVISDWGNRFARLEQVKGVPFWNRTRWQKGMLKGCARALERRNESR